MKESIIDYIAMLSSMEDNNMIVKSSNDYHITFISSILILSIFTIVQIYLSKNHVLFILFLPIIFMVRGWVTLGRTLIMDEKGCTVKFLIFSRTYQWKDLQTKIIDRYENCYGYRQPYNSGAYFSLKEVKKHRRLKPGEYSFLCHPFSFFFVYFKCEDNMYLKNTYSEIYEVDEIKFRNLMNKWHVDATELSLGKTADS